MSNKNKIGEVKTLSSAERRAVRAEHVQVEDAEPYGWMARSNKNRDHVYHLFCDPATHRLVCTCADFIFRSDLSLNYECKHITATLKHIARCYLNTTYTPHKQHTLHAA